MPRDALKNAHRTALPKTLPAIAGQGALEFRVRPTDSTLAAAEPSRGRREPASAPAVAHLVDNDRAADGVGTSPLEMPWRCAERRTSPRNQATKVPDGRPAGPAGDRWFCAAARICLPGSGPYPRTP
jgi:hypothetical protein